MISVTTDDSEGPRRRRARSRKRQTRQPDWRFQILADFEDLLRSYGQDHVSLLN